MEQTYAGKQLFVTGATGFLAKVRIALPLQLS